jgi:hypothetical protein
MRFGALAYFDRINGVISRYEIGGYGLHKTHTGRVGDPADLPMTLDAEFCETFRAYGQSDLYCGPLAPIPGGSNPGGSPMSMAA